MPDSRNWFKPTPSSRRRSLLGSQRDGTSIVIHGKRMLNFASNDYLGLATHPDVIKAACNAIEKHGLGSGASRLISGDDPLIHQLESELAEWKSYEACLVVGSGMLANLGLLQALADRHTHMYADKLNHASLVDGVRLSGAACHRFSHLDMDQLESLLQKHPAPQRIIVSDGVFSMDGDCADLARLLTLTETSDALLIIDDAHGTGTIGPAGRGLTAMAKIAGHPRLIEVGTLGKAFGGYGSFILGSSEVIEGLRQRMRTLIYSTALPAALPAAALAALRLIREGSLVEKLNDNLTLFCKLTAGLALMPSQTPIQPLVAGEDEQALAMTSQLKELGFFVPAIRPPTVPEGTARLRITLSSAHSHDEITQLAKALTELV